MHHVFLQKPGWRRSNFSAHIHVLSSHCLILIKIDFRFQEIRRNLQKPQHNGGMSGTKRADHFELSKAPSQFLIYTRRILSAINPSAFSTNEEDVLLLL